MEIPKKISFGEFDLDLSEAEIRKDGTIVRVEPQVFDLLWYFATNAGKLISRDDLILGVWNGRIVSDAAISTRINGARNAIDDNGTEQRLIRTIPRRGFRFLADVQIVEPCHSNSTIPTSTALSNSTANHNDKPAIAIMPFEVILGDEETLALAEGMRIDVQNALIKVSGLYLTAVGSISAVKDMDPLDAANALNARYLLTGQLRRSNEVLRLTIQLLDAETNRVILSEKFDHELVETYKVLDEVVAEVLQTLNIALVAGEPARVWHQTLRDIDSLAIFYRGINNFFEMNREALSFAREDFEKIARRHQGLAIGPTWTALTHWFDLQRGWSQDTKLSRKLARKTAEKAVTLRDPDGQAHTVLSHVYLLEGNFDAALQAGENAVANRPSCTNANAFYANVLHYCGQDTEALNHIRLALHQSPFCPPLFRLILVKVLLALKRYEEAENTLGSVFQSGKMDVSSCMLGCLVAGLQQKSELARNHAARVMQLDPAFSLKAYLDGEPYRDGGTKDFHAKELARYGFS